MEKARGGDGKRGGGCKNTPKQRLRAQSQTRKNNCVSGDASGPESRGSHSTTLVAAYHI